MDFAFDKEKWKQDAFERIKEKLFFSQSNRNVGSLNDAKENHLVVIYGITQVGKTTLILNMIGIQEQYFQTVYKTLRAGQEVGSSSTSTAIIYSKSDSDKYRIAFREINSIAVSDREEYDSDGLIKRLKRVRDDVENGRLDPQYILDIAIPQQYFEIDARNYNISILDLPGDDSKNAKEMIHVSKLLARYIPIASTCIIAARSGYIQPLETLELPNKVSWKDMHHRFVVVITRAYSDNDIKSFFKKNKSYSTEDFYEYVQTAYEESVREIPGLGNKTEVYPIDLGESLSVLCRENGLTDKDISAIEYAKNTTLKKLRDSINSREGNRLSAALQDLKVVVNAYFNTVSERLNDEIRKQDDEIRKLEKQRELNENVIKGLKNREKDFSEKDEIEKKLSELRSAKVTLDAEYWWENIDKHYKDKKWYRLSKPPHIKSFYRSRAYDHFYYYISERVQEYIDEEFGELINSNSVDEVIEEHRVKMKIELFRVDKFRGPDITQDKLHNCVIDVAEVVSEAIKKSINAAIVDLKKRRDSENDKEAGWDVLLKERLNHLEEIKSNIKNFERKIQNIKNELTTLEKNKQNDVDTLDQYLSIAKDAYLEYRNDMISRLNSVNTSPAEKTKLIFEVGVLDKDYLKITGGTEN